MKPERMRIKLAEWAGWKRAFVGWQPKGDPVPRGWHNPSGREKSDCPDYPNDLNAVRELETKLTLDQCRSYGRVLAAMAECDCWYGDEIELGGVELFCIAHLGPIYRCEALCRTLDLWEDE